MDTNLISEKDLSLLKIKLGKSRRNQKDWDWISELLVSHDVVVPQYVGEKSTAGNETAIIIGEMLPVFTSAEECGRQMQVFAREIGKATEYRMTVRPYEEMAMTADAAGLTLCVDPKTDGKNRFLTYKMGRIEAALIY